MVCKMSELDSSIAGQIARRLYRPAFWSIVFVALGAIYGCSSTPTPAPSTADFVTDSDESPARKRAKIRLELAAGYFNNGQTTVALDEVKQSIAADPGLFEAHNLRGLIYMALNDFPLADESFRRALQLSPRAASVQHNYAWMLCQQGRMPESFSNFSSAINNPLYSELAKSWMALGICQMKSGLRNEALVSLTRAQELDPGSPVAGYNLALLLFQQGDLSKSQLYVRRINNSEFANSETLWLGIKVEQGLGNKGAVTQLGTQLLKRFPKSKEAASFERGAFNE
jgi:type IV pilus assembly protein PilF